MERAWVLFNVHAFQACTPHFIQGFRALCAPGVPGVHEFALSLALYTTHPPTYLPYLPPSSSFLLKKKDGMYTKYPSWDNLPVLLQKKRGTYLKSMCPPCTTCTPSRGYSAEIDVNSRPCDLRELIFRPHLVKASSARRN